MALALSPLARRRCGSAALAVFLLSARLAATPPTEHEVKAAYLYNFLKFVEWPKQGNASATGPFCIAILGADPFGPVLDSTVAAKEVLGRRVTVRRVAEPKAAAGCHVVFVGRQQNVSTAGTLRLLEGTGALTVQ